jgi:hypothetical protein
MILGAAIFVTVLKAGPLPGLQANLRITLKNLPAAETLHSRRGF